MYLGVLFDVDSMIRNYYTLINHRSDIRMKTKYVISPFPELYSYYYYFYIINYNDSLFIHKNINESTNGIALTL